VVYNLRPYEDLPEPEPNTDDILSEFISRGGVRFCDPYENWTTDERMRLFDGFHAAYLTSDGNGAASGLIECPGIVLERNSRFLDNVSEEAVEEILKISGAKGELEKVAAEDRARYSRRCAGRIVWQMETARNVAMAQDASGIVVAPQWQPLWIAERKSVAHSLARQFELLEEAIKLHHCGDDIELDLSPLTAIALDTTTEMEMLAENILLLRRDYSELRDIGRRYRDALAAADTYRDISDAVREWRNAWDLVIREARFGRAPLIRKLFSWDLFKKGSWSGMLFEAAATTGKELSDIVLRKGLTIAQTFESEFLLSSPIQHSIKRLFGRDR
jgi:hypothetical protein